MGKVRRGWCALVGAFLGLFIGGVFSSLLVTNNIQPTSERCQAIIGSLKPALPCELATNPNIEIVTEVRPNDALKSSSYLLVLYGGTFSFGATLAVYLVRRPGTPLLQFIRDSTLGEIVAMLVACVVGAGVLTMLSNPKNSWHPILVLLMDNTLSPTDWDATFTALLCTSSETDISRLELFFHFVNFGSGAMAVDFAFHAIAFAFDRTQAKFGSGVEVRVMDALYAIFVAWGWAIIRNVPGLRWTTIWVLVTALQTFRVPRVLEKFSAFGLLKIGQMDTLASQYRKHLIVLLLTLAKALLYFLSASLVVMACEGFPCQFLKPKGANPCDCASELREVMATLYFIFTTGATVGYGDFFPRTDLGRAVVMIFMVLGISTFPSWISTIFEASSNMAKCRREQNKRERLKRSSTQLSAIALSNLPNSDFSASNLGASSLQYAASSGDLGGDAGDSETGPLQAGSGVSNQGVIEKNQALIHELQHTRDDLAERIKERTQQIKYLQTFLGESKADWASESDGEMTGDEAVLVVKHARRPSVIREVEMVDRQRVLNLISEMK
eukprot:c10711_g1_i2.p1 GENE.c10711_g1_i2~~c10711_g1_i2.p1  ORF type:complete len:566 (+),score=133.02 c10711_g1_i2:34-1698(+)